MAYLAWWPAWLHACELSDWWMTCGALAGSTLPSLSVLRSFALLIHFCPYSSHWFLVYFHLMLFSFFVSLPFLSIFFGLFVSVSLASPLCQHFTMDIQLLAGHSIVIPFRAAPFSMGLKQPFKLHPRLPQESLLCKMLFSNISGATT